jgi:putative (di)nucleoside polyphosphate hydrolase
MDRDLSQHRPNVGIMLINSEGLVWLGRRAGSRPPLNWQFPQGGIDEGEALETAARRELQEETGVTSAVVLGYTESWIAYDFPPELTGSKAARGWKGQKQKWFAMRFAGVDSEIKLDHHEEIEFDAWRWASLAEVPGLVVPFKQDAYARLFSELGHLVVPI